MTNLSQGLYYALLTEALQEELRRLDPNFISRGTLHHADVADRIAMHVARVVERAISGISDSERVAGGVELARTLIASGDACFLQHNFSIRRFCFSLATVTQR